MSEPISDERIEHISAVLSVPDVGGVSEALARELLAEVQRLRAEADTVAAMREYLTKLKRGVLQWGSYTIAGIAVWNACHHLLGWPVWASWAACVGAGVVIGWSQAEIENRLEARRG